MNNIMEGCALDLKRGCVLVMGLMLPILLVVGAVLYWIIAGGRP